MSISLRYLTTTQIETIARRIKEHPGYQEPGIGTLAAMDAMALSGDPVLQRPVKMKSAERYWHNKNHAAKTRQWYIDHGFIKPVTR